MLRKLLLLLTLFVILGASPLFKISALATDEFGECTLPNKPTNLDEGDRVIPAGLIINTNGNADPSQGYYVFIRRTDGYGGQGGVISGNDGPILFHPDNGGNIIINYAFDHNGNTVGDHLDPFRRGDYGMAVTDINMDSKCQQIFYDPTRISTTLYINIASGISHEDPPTPNSCPLCPDGYAWNYQYNLCSKGTDYVPSVRRVDCSAEGTTCNAGEGYCSNPSPPQACKTYGSLNSNCNPANGDPGDCNDNLICQDESSKCVRAQARLGDVCYKCGAAYTWNGQYCADSNNGTCIAPESRAYCAEGSSCTQGKGCQKNTEPPPAEQDKSKPLKTPCEKSLSGTVSDGEECTGVFSGLGVRLPTDPLELIPQILSVILGISGGIVILLIIRAGYKLMFSQGNPEKVQEARDELTSAIVGLLFIIFSFVLLQFITNDLFKIDTLTSGKDILIDIPKTK